MPCEPSTSETAPAARTRAAISLTGLIVPSTLEMWAKAASFTRPDASSSSSWSSERRPSSETSSQRSSAPTSWQSSCHGTMFEWCSIWVISTTSPRPTCSRPHA